jgi:chondroitin 4-sulfotransferase 11
VARTPLPHVLGQLSRDRPLLKPGHLAYVKGNLELLGLGHAYHDAWWRWTARKRSPLTQWNYHHETIFIHIPKTAGLSIYEMLGMDQPYDTHAPVSGYRVADRALFEKAFKFAVVRNPWDRVVSAFHYLKYKPISPNDARWSQDEWWSERYLASINSFPEFLHALRVPKFRRFVLTWRHFIPQHYFLTTNKSGLLVNHLVRFEDLDKELQAIAWQIGAPISAAQRNVTEHKAYQHYYSEADVRFVGAIYARDVELFGYTFAPSGAMD